jgi:hypothetical protein
VVPSEGTPSAIPASRETSIRGLVAVSWGDSEMGGGGEGELVGVKFASVFAARLREDSLARDILDESGVEFFRVTSTTFGRSVGVLLRFTA